MTLEMPAWLKALPLILLPAAGLGAALWLWSQDHANLKARLDTQVATAAREAKEAKLKAEGLVVEARRDASDLKADLDQEATKNAALQKALDDAKKLEPKTKLVYVEKIVTKPGPAQAPVAQGEPLQIRLVNAKMETREHVPFLVGAGQVWKLTPPETLLYEQPLDEKLSFAEAPPPPLPPPRPGGSMGISARMVSVERRASLVYGASGSLVPFAWDRLEVHGQAEANRSGDWAVGVQLEFRLHR